MEELRAHIAAHHVRHHAELAREVRLKRWQRSTPPDRQARTLAYLAGDPAEQAAAEFAEVAAHPRIWAHCVAWIAERAELRERAKRLHPGCGFDSGPPDGEPLAAAWLHFRYMKTRAFMPGAYGRPRGGDPHAAKEWDSLCEPETAPHAALATP